MYLCSCTTTAINSELAPFGSINCYQLTIYRQSCSAPMFIIHTLDVIEELLIGRRLTSSCRLRASSWSTQSTSSTNPISSFSRHRLLLKSSQWHLIRKLKISLIKSSSASAWTSWQLRMRSRLNMSLVNLSSINKLKRKNFVYVNLVS